MEKLERAIDVLAHSGKVPSKVEVICEALEGLLDKKDPARRAERAEKRRAAKEGVPSGRKEAAKKINQANNISTAKTDTKPSQSSGRKERVLVPTAVKYRVYLRSVHLCRSSGKELQRAKNARVRSCAHALSRGR